MKRRTISLLLCALLALGMLAGCSGKAPAAPEETAAEPSRTSAEKPAELPPAESLAGETWEEAAPADLARALDLAAALLRLCPEGNTLLSPASILCALGMALNGAAGETREGLEEALGFTAGELNAAMEAWLAALDREDGPLHLADGIWISDDPELEIEPGFLAQCREKYAAAAERLAFDGKALEEINAFVRENTAGMIDGILDAIPRDAMVYLVSALAFEADWETVYREDQVRPGYFTAADGAEQKAEFLHSTEWSYLEDGNSRGFLKYYEGRRWAFAALLPEEGMSLSAYIDGLSGEKFRSLLETKQEVKVETSMPKFTAQDDLELGSLLAALGAADAFDPERADFSALGCCKKGENLCISRVLHRTCLKLDEKGTQAGAATAVEIVKATALMEPEPVRRVDLDRPFLYLLLDTESGMPLFIGTVSSLE
ncbi:MAG: serpin family protein [Oscillospiraceae bacterium]|nr:serpin family protein [Oscillospiraceae bacterium]